MPTIMENITFGIQSKTPDVFAVISKHISSWPLRTVRKKVSALGGFLIFLPTSPLSIFMNSPCSPGGGIIRSSSYTVRWVTLYFACHYSEEKSIESLLRTNTSSPQFGDEYTSRRPHCLQWLAWQRQARCWRGELLGVTPGNRTHANFDFFFPVLLLQ